MKRLLFILITISLGTLLSAQNDSAKLTRYDYSFSFKEGLYLDFYSFSNNSPLQFQSLSYPSYGDKDFFQILDTAKTISFFDDYGIVVTINSNNLWGYSRNGKPYIYWAEKFNLVPFVGAVSHFITTIKVQYSTYRDPFYDPYYYNPSARTYQSEEIRQYLIDMETGNILEYSLKNVESILQREPEIYTDFSKLSKRKKSKQMFYYIKLYNEKRGLWILE